MRTSITRLLFAVLLFTSAATGLRAQSSSPAIKEASLVTEVLPWGETIMAVRLELSEEVFCGETMIVAGGVASDDGKYKFRLDGSDRSVTAMYVNNSGKKDDVQLYGKYIFIDLGIKNQDPTTYRTQVTFDGAHKTRDRLTPFTITQLAPVTTHSGKVIAPSTVTTSRELCLGQDDYTTYTYTNPATGHVLTYNLYIPKGYESKGARKNLPLVAHFPAGDFSYKDWTGKYRGALFTHHDVLYWSDEDAQAKNPAFVVTVGGPVDPTWAIGDYDKSEMEQNYYAVVQKIMADFNVDPTRVYAVSLAGGSPPMWSTIMAHPHLFAAQISTSYDPYHAYKNAKLGEDKMAALLKTLPGWFFAGMYDPTGYGILGPADTRQKGERLRDIAELMNKQGLNVDIGYGKGGEWMWNGLARGDAETRLATDQLARAKAHNANRLVTVYMPGTILVSQHWVWDATYSNAGVRNWLFQQVNKTPSAK
jgi:predicted peptidase